MNQSQLQPAKNFAVRNGVKMVGYGPPGSGKTPMMQTAPRPVICVCEPGMMTMRNSNLPAWGAETFDKAREFYTWVSQSAEAKQFDTVVLDSGSELAEICLREQMRKTAHGMKAYGEMSRLCMEIFDGLFHLPNKHVYIICKQVFEETVATSMQNGLPVIETKRKAKPMMPGQDLPMKFSHRYDLVAQINKGPIPGVEGVHGYIRCHESDSVTARDRSGNLAEYEPQDLTALFKKAML